MTASDSDIRATVLAWYAAYKDGLFGYLAALLGNHADAQDVLQGTFVDLLGKGVTVFDIRHPKTYVYRMARYQAFSLLRNGRHVLQGDAALLDAMPARDETAAYTAADAASWALAQLAPVERELIVMKVYEELSFKDIARITGSLLPTVATRYFRALRKMRALLEDHNEHT
ncbi:RNA polymerase sigma factor [bacterium]|nr:RNA polymerase sigma factor [bacterium]